MDPLEHIRAVAERVARSHGVEVFDVQMRRESVGPVLRVMIDRPAPPDDTPERIEDGIGIQECQRVSVDLSAVLDVEDAMDRRYILEVSSPGLDRPLRGLADYRRFAGRLAKMILSEPVDGQTHFKGRLRGTDGDTVLIDDEQGRAQRVPLGSVTRARLEVEF
jgi:ribosome maturation factor RimP